MIKIIIGIMSLIFATATVAGAKKMNQQASVSEIIDINYIDSESLSESMHQDVTLYLRKKRKWDKLDFKVNPDLLLTKPFQHAIDVLKDNTKLKSSPFSFLYPVFKNSSGHMLVSKNAFIMERPVEAKYFTPNYQSGQKNISQLILNGHLSKVIATHDSDELSTVEMEILKYQKVPLLGKKLAIKAQGNLHIFSSPTEEQLLQNTNSYQNFSHKYLLKFLELDKNIYEELGHPEYSVVAYFPTSNSQLFQQAIIVNQFIPFNQNQMLVINYQLINFNGPIPWRLFPSKKVMTRGTLESAYFIHNLKYGSYIH